MWENYKCTLSSKCTYFMHNAYAQILCMHVHTKLMIYPPLSVSLSLLTHRHVWHSQKHFILVPRSRWHWYSWWEALTESCVGERERWAFLLTAFPTPSLKVTPTLICQKQNTHVWSKPAADTDAFWESRSKAKTSATQANYDTYKLEHCPVNKIHTSAVNHVTDYSHSHTHTSYTEETDSLLESNGPWVSN